MDPLILSIDQVFFVGLIPIALAFLVHGADDAFIDLVAFIRRLGPKRVTRKEFQAIFSRPEKNIAVMVANWKESGVLSRMVRGNMSRLNYKNVHFFLGVYPNDVSTVEEAFQLEKLFPNVHVVVNEKDGPTSKGQMLNRVVEGIFKFEISSKITFDFLLMQDSEDIMHPDSLKVINWEGDHHDFIQVPVFSLPASPMMLVRGIYKDEFAEYHLKDLFVREYLSKGVPSAGVGTALSRSLVKGFLSDGRSELFNERSVTEDYELGMEAAQKGFRATFACWEIVNEDGSHELVSTREHFPKHFVRSIRQKTRWTLGIAFQGWRFLGWKGTLWQKYFYYRDRKAPFANAVVLFGMIITAWNLGRSASDPIYWDRFWSFYSSAGLEPFALNSALILNMAFMSNRLIQRSRLTMHLYGLPMVLLVIPRLLIGNIINAAAAVRAAKEFTQSVLTNKAPSWSKTEHEMPDGFGEEVPVVGKENSPTATL